MGIPSAGVGFEIKKQCGKCRSYARDVREVKNSQRPVVNNLQTRSEVTSGECMDVRQMKIAMTKKGDSFQVSPDEFKNRIREQWNRPEMRR